MYLLDNKDMVHLISWHQVKNDKELSNDLLEIKQAGLILENKVRICIIGDGAPWIWNRAKEIYPDAKKVLDYYHCSEYLHDLANAQYGKNTQKTREWVEATLTRLFLNKADQIIAGIKHINSKSSIYNEMCYNARKKNFFKYNFRCRYLNNNIFIKFRISGFI